MNKEKYYLDNLKDHVSAIGGHYTNLKLAIEGKISHENFETEDGISGVINFIFDNIGIEHHSVIDIGAYSKLASNVMPLIMKHNLQKNNIFLFDGENKHSDPDVFKVWLTVENINTILEQHGCNKKNDIICIDVDNMDYWLLEKILKNKYDTNVIVVEFNPIFNNKESFVKKYNKDAKKMDSDTQGSSNYGASLKAFIDLLSAFDYIPVYTSETVNNAIFIKKKFDTLGRFSQENIEQLHSMPYVEKHKNENNLKKYGTSELESVKKIIIKNFTELKNE